MELSAAMSEIGAELILEVIRDWAHYQKVKRKQPVEGVTYGKSRLFI